MRVLLDDEMMCLSSIRYVQVLDGMKGDVQSRQAKRGRANLDSIPHIIKERMRSY